MSGPRLQQSEQTTTFPAHPCVTGRLVDFMLGNSRMKLPNISYRGTLDSEDIERPKSRVQDQDVSLGLGL